MKNYRTRIQAWGIRRYHALMSMIPVRRKQQAEMLVRTVQQTNLRGIRYTLIKLERHPNTRKLRKFLDEIITIVGNKKYKGDNPAMRAAYGPLRSSLIVMLILGFVIFGLGSTVPIESAAIAHGKVVVASNKKTIQHLEGGIIKEILVEDGDRVKAGQPLMELSDVAPKANRDISKNEMYAARVAKARLMALKKGDDTISIDAEVLEAAAQNPEMENTIDSQRDQFETQKQAQASKVKTLQQRVRQYEEEVRGIESQLQSADAQIALIDEEIEPMGRLVSKGYASKPQLLALQRRKEELAGNKGQYLASVAKARESMTEAQLQIDSLQNDFEAQLAEELRVVRNKVSDEEQKYKATSDVLDRTMITAPYEGIVTGLKYHTVGGVIAPGTPIMDIVPQSDTLVVEAKVLPTDIDVVRMGLKARLVFSAFNNRSVPGLSGKVVRVSADAISVQDEQTAMPMPYYMARVEVNDEELAKLNRSITLTPGMPVEVYIRTGSRSFLSYMFAPITRSFGRAFKED